MKRATFNMWLFFNIAFSNYFPSNTDLSKSPLKVKAC